MCMKVHVSQTSVHVADTTIAEQHTRALSRERSDDVHVVSPSMTFAVAKHENLPALAITYIREVWKPRATTVQGTWYDPMLTRQRCKVKFRSVRKHTWTGRMLRITFAMLRCKLYTLLILHVSQLGRSVYGSYTDADDRFVDRDADSQDIPTSLLSSAVASSYIGMTL